MWARSARSAHCRVSRGGSKRARRDRACSERRPVLSRETVALDQERRWLCPSRKKSEFANPLVGFPRLSTCQTSSRSNVLHTRPSSRWERVRKRTRTKVWVPYSNQCFRSRTSLSGLFSNMFHSNSNLRSSTLKSASSVT